MTHVRADLSRAGLGALTWIVAAAVLRPALAVTMLLLAAFVAVPLGVPLAVCEESRLRRAVSRLQWPAGLCLACSFAESLPAIATALAVPWLILTVMVAAIGLRRLWDHHNTAGDLSLGCGLVYLAIGGGWLAFSRAGVRPLAFPDVIVLLTAVHFHYAGFCLPILAGRVALATRGTLARWACLGAVAGVPLVAAGITLSQLKTGPALGRPVELLAALFLATAVITVGLLQVRLALRIEAPALPRVGLALSGVAPVGPLVLAVLYAWANLSHVYWLDIATMVRYHGAVIALGFALPGLASWQGLPHDRVPGTRDLSPGNVRVMP